MISKSEDMIRPLMIGPLRRLRRSEEKKAQVFVVPLRPFAQSADQPSSRRCGFTLLELVLVMMLLCIAAAIAVPSLRGFREGQRMRGASAQVVSLAQWARAQAVTRAVPYRLNVDAATGTYWLTAERAGVFEMLGEDLGRVFELPDGITIESYGAPVADSPFPCVEFLPTGRTVAAARVRLTDANGAITEIACLSPAEPFQVRPVVEAR